MPDHVHFFCRPELDAKALPEFIGAWKSWTGKRINKLLAPGSATPGYNCNRAVAGGIF